jgi:outer membrane protein, multidrug efflux system
MSAHRYLILITMAALTAACAAQRQAPLPQDVPASFENANPAGGQWPGQEWYREFGSDELDTFIDLAAKTNWDLAAARARVAQADVRARQARAAILPTIDANGTGNDFAGHSSHGSGHEFDWSAMLSANYEVDFWDKNRATADSARFLAGASRAEQDTVALTTLTGVGNGYFQVLALRECPIRALN